MRRARIKAVATVPVRRKVAQDSAPAAPLVQTDAKESEKLPDKNYQPNNNESDAATPDAHEKSIEKINTPQSLQKPPVSPIKQKNQELENVPRSLQKVPVCPVKEKECLEVSAQASNKLPISSLKEKVCLEVNAQDPNKEVDEKINSQVSQKNDYSQKSAAAPVEASLVKTHQSRSHFMRPTPRLDGSGRIRRNSIQGSGASASESEDDSRRSSSIVPSRVRNDSICSTLSLKDTGNISKLNLGQKRRMVVSESARKLAEARREFLLKHEKNPPDKSKLTMYDLIYYNPVTNPMTPKPLVNKPAARKNSICSSPVKREEEIVDEPAELLVPQVKVGPNGQLIIDEQSLVIEQYKAPEIDRADILVDDEGNSGFYKRRSKSKDWTKWETLKFYKALNTYGTDFLLMQSIFPKRTRQELKLKYKKEEKINHNLVEKALVYQEFDTEQLEKDLAKVDENERLESESNKKVKEQKKEKDKKRKRARCQKLVEEVNCEDEQNSDANKNSADGQSSDGEKMEKPAPKKRRATRKRKVIKSDTNSSNESLNNDSDSNPESYEVLTTRSGRTSRKIKKLQKPKTNKSKEKVKRAAKINDKQNNNVRESTLEVEGENPQCNGEKNRDDASAIEEQNEIENTNTNILNSLTTDTNISTVPNEITDMSSMEPLQPGSWVVLTKDSIDEPGKKIIQHYIVSPDYDANDPNKKDNFIPITLPPDVLKTVTNCIQNIEPQNIS